MFAELDADLAHLQCQLTSGHHDNGWKIKKKKKEVEITNMIDGMLFHKLFSHMKLIWLFSFTVVLSARQHKDGHLLY